MRFKEQKLHVGCLDLAGYKVRSQSPRVLDRPTHTLVCPNYDMTMKVQLKAFWVKYLIVTD